MSSEKKNRGIIVFLILLISLIGYLSYQNVKDYNNLKEAFTLEKENLESDLNKIIADYDKIIDQNVKLESNLKEKKLMVMQLRDSIKNLQENNFQLIRSYRNRILSLEEENRGLFLKIDYLNNTNSALLEENTKVKQQLEQKESLAYKLKNQNKELDNYSKDLQEKVEEASEIEIFDVVVEAMRNRTEEKYVSTTKYKKTDAFKITFKLKENRIAESGNRKVYVSVFDENDKILESKGDIFLKNGRQVPYSSEVSFNYNNSEISLFSFVKVDSKELIKGDYFFKIYSNGKLLNANVLTLK